MTQLLRILTAALLCYTPVACTQLTVTKYDPKKSSTGLVYSLPKPFLQVTPKPDGTISVDVVYLPDSDNTFFIQSTSYLSSHTLNIARDGGFLKSADFNVDTTAAATVAAQTAGTFATETLKSENAKAQAQQTALASAQKAVQDAQLQVELAQKKLDLLTSLNADPGKIIDARVALEQAILQRDAARDTLSRLLGNNRGSPSNSNLNNPSAANAGSPTAAVGTSGTTPTPPPTNTSTPTAPPSVKGTVAKPVSGNSTGFKQVPGPVLYAINEHTDTDGKVVLELKAAAINGQSPQASWDTSSLPPSPIKPEFFPRGYIVVTPDAHGALIAVLTPTEKLTDVTVTGFVKDPATSATTQPVGQVTATLENPLKIDLTFNSSVGAGDYAVDLSYNYVDENKHLIPGDPVTAKIRVVK